MAVRYRVLDPAQYGKIDVTTRCTKGGRKLDVRRSQDIQQRVHLRPLGASGKKSGVAVIHRASGSPYMLARTRRVTSLIAMGAVIVGTIVA